MQRLRFSAVRTSSSCIIRTVVPAFAGFQSWDRHYRYCGFVNGRRGRPLRPLDSDQSRVYAYAIRPRPAWPLDLTRIDRSSSKSAASMPAIVGFFDGENRPPFPTRTYESRSPSPRSISRRERVLRNRVRRFTWPRTERVLETVILPSATRLQSQTISRSTNALKADRLQSTWLELRRFRVYR